MGQPSPTIAVNLNIPSALLDELWRWYLPRDALAPRRERAPPLGQCFDAKICAVFPQAYKESLVSLNALKEVRTMVEHLSSVVNDGIASMEKELRHASRCYGMFSLPSRIVTTIMGLVTDALADDVKKSNEMRWVFLETPPFSAYATSDRALLRKWREAEAIWEGPIPVYTSTMERNLISIITTFHFTTESNATLQQIAYVLERMRRLENLRIEANFSHESMKKKTVLENGIQYGSVTLPSLKRLYLSEGYPSGDGSLCLIVDMLHLPNLTHIGMVRCAYTVFTHDRGGETFIASFDKRKFPSVTNFSIDKICDTSESDEDYENAYMNLERTLETFPALSSLTLGSCQSVHYYYAKPLDTRNIPPIRHIRLQWDEGKYDMRLFRNGRADIYICGSYIEEQCELIKLESVESVEVVTNCDRYTGEIIYESVKSVACNAAVTWVTDSSILEDAY